MCSPFWFLFCVIYVSRLADDAYLNLSGIIKLALNLLRNVTCENLHGVIGDNLGLNHDSNLTACLNSEGLFNTLEVTGNLLKLLESLNVVLNVLTSSTGTSRADCVSCLDDEVESRLRLDIILGLE